MRSHINKRTLAAVCIGLLALGALSSAGPLKLETSRPATTTSAPSLSALEALLAQRNIEDGKVVTPQGWLALPQVKRPPLPESIDKAFVIPIHDEIDQTMLKAIKRKILRCRAGGAQIVIFDVDSPGGEIGAMEGIARDIRENLSDIYTVAFINPEAYSAAAFISLRCNEIVITPPAILGDAMPITFGSDGPHRLPKDVRAKFETPMLVQIGQLAKDNGYNVDLCEAMIQPEIEIWLIQNSKTQELRYVNYTRPPGKILNAPTTSRPAAVAVGEEEWKFLEVVKPRDEQLLTMDAEKLVQTNFTHVVAADMPALQKHYNIVKPPVVLEDNWSESLVAFLTSAPVVAFLMGIAILAIYTESHLPHGLGFVIAIVCFATVFGSRYLIGMANWWQIAVLMLGLILLAVEIFITPGMLVLGAIGVACIILGIVGMLIPASPGKFLPDTPLQWDAFSNGLFAVMVAFLLATACLPLLAKYLPRVPLAGKLVLPSVVVGPVPQLAENSPLRNIRPGDVGLAESLLRPAGKVRFGDLLTDAESEGGIIEAGAKVRVLRLEGSSIVVEKMA